MGNRELIYGDTTRPLWRSHEAIRVLHGKAYDLVVTTTMKGIRYEDSAFAHIADNLTSSTIALGPHLIDAIFTVDTTPSWFYLTRPDAFIFSKTEGTWQLIELAEIKATSVRHLQDKVDGFSILLSCLRKNDSFVSRQLELIIGDTLPLPKNISVPEDASVGVHVISPNVSHAMVRQYNTKFPIRYSQLQ